MVRGYGLISKLLFDSSVISQLMTLTFGIVYLANKASSISCHIGGEGWKFPLIQVLTKKLKRCKLGVKSIILFGTSYESKCSFLRVELCITYYRASDVFQESI